MNWEYLNRHRITKPTVTVPELYCSTPEDGFNGLFRMILDGQMVRCLASDGGGWKHVSVSLEYQTKPPSWSIMCQVKDLFWDDETWVVQYHPAKSQYVNHHPGCLHLWEYTGGGPFQMPVPHSLLVGPKGQ